MKRILTLILFALSLIAMGLSAFMFHQQFWRWRDCFNEDERCFAADEGVVYHAQSGMTYALLLIVFSFLTVLIFGKLRHLKHDKTKDA